LATNSLGIPFLEDLRIAAVYAPVHGDLAGQPVSEAYVGDGEDYGGLDMRLL